MRIVFFGTPDFGVPALKALAGAHQVVAAITQPDRAGNRGQVFPGAVKTAASTLGIPVFSYERVRDHVDELAAFGADLGVTAAYGQILTQSILDVFPHGIMNVHGSLLPRYRGASPIQAAVMDGETITGITIMQTARGVDTGDILSQVKVEIGEDETAPELFLRLSGLVPQLLLETVEACADGRLCPVPQDERRATHCRLLTKQSGNIDFGKSAKQVYNLFRGTFGWPGATFRCRGKSMKLLACHVVQAEGVPGKILSLRGGITVACGEGAVVIEHLREAGGKAMSAKDYLRGHALSVGESLC